MSSVKGVRWWRGQRLAEISILSACAAGRTRRFAWARRTRMVVAGFNEKIGGPAERTEGSI